MIVENANNIKLNISLFFIILFMNEFSNVIINVLSKLKHTMFVLNDVVLNYYCEIRKFSH